MSISRKKIVMILIMLFLLLASIFGTAYIDRVGEYKRAVKETTIEEVNISDIPDGVYIGEYDVNFIYAKVRVAAPSIRSALLASCWPRPQQRGLV